LRVTIAHDFFFENYRHFLNVASAAGKNDIELVDEMGRVLDLSFLTADMFISKVYEQKKESNDNV
jgi:hypothetical protein